MSRQHCALTGCITDTISSMDIRMMPVFDDMDPCGHILVTMLHHL
jgi:hypothetical protein